MAADLIIRCAECGTDFVCTVAEQETGARPERCPMCQLLAPLPGRARGIVKWFSRARGYGFIAPVAGPDLFLHQSGLAAGQAMPRGGQLVEFGMASSSRGLQAVDVIVLESPAKAPDAVHG